jgi:hypothetical protein
MRSGIMRKSASDAGSGSVGGSYETAFATPASFALIQNNPTLSSPERPVSHPRLGINGVRFTGRQPLAVIQPCIDLGAALGYFFNPLTSTANIPALTGQYIDMSPLNLNGPLANKAMGYEKYAYHKVRLVYTTTQTTTFVGTASLALIDDPAVLHAITSFDATRMITPSVMFPYRVPQAGLNWTYGGDELFYVHRSSGAVASLAESRQYNQLTLIGFDSGSINTVTPGTTVGYLDLEYDIDFYDPIPPTANPSMVNNMTERHAVAKLLEAMRVRAPSKHLIVPPEPSAVLSAAIKALALESAASAGCPLGAPDVNTDPSRYSSLSSSVSDDDEPHYPVSLPQLIRTDSTRFSAARSRA